MFNTSYTLHLLGSTYILHKIRCYVQSAKFCKSYYVLQRNFYCLKGMLDGVCLRISIEFFPYPMNEIRENFTKSTIEVLICVELKLIQFEYFVE